MRHPTCTFTGVPDRIHERWAYYIYICSMFIKHIMVLQACGNARDNVMLLLCVLYDVMVCSFYFNEQSQRNYAHT